MWRDGGIRPFLKGTSPTILRDLTFGGVYSLLRNGLLRALREVQGEGPATSSTGQRQQQGGKEAKKGGSGSVAPPVGMESFVLNVVAAGIATTVRRKDRRLCSCLGGMVDCLPACLPLPVCPPPRQSLRPCVRPKGCTQTVNLRQGPTRPDTTTHMSSQHNAHHTISPQVSGPFNYVRNIKYSFPADMAPPSSLVILQDLVHEVSREKKKNMPSIDRHCW